MHRFALDKSALRRLAARSIRVATFHEWIHVGTSLDSTHVETFPTSAPGRRSSEATSRPGRPDTNPLQFATSPSGSEFAVRWRAWRRTRRPRRTMPPRPTRSPRSEKCPQPLPRPCLRIRDARRGSAVPGEPASVHDLGILPTHARANATSNTNRIQHTADGRFGGLSKVSASDDNLCDRYRRHLTA